MTEKTQGLADTLAIKAFLENNGWIRNIDNPDQYSLQCEDCVYFLDVYVINKGGDVNE